MKKITVDAKAFADAMNKVSKVLRKSPLPILEEVAVRIQDDRCTLTATDMETWLVAELPAHGDDMSFVFRRTKDVLKACAHFEGELTLMLAFYNVRPECSVFCTAPHKRPITTDSSAFSNKTALRALPN